MRLTLSARNFGEVLAALALAFAFLPPVSRFWMGAAAVLVLLSAFNPELFGAASRRFQETARRWPALRYRLVGIPAFFVFFFLFVPLGLVLRVVGRDRIGRRLRRNAPSYWEQPARPNVGSLKDPF